MVKKKEGGKEKREREKCLSGSSVSAEMKREETSLGGCQRMRGAARVQEGSMKREASVAATVCGVGERKGKKRKETNGCQVDVIYLRAVSRNGTHRTRLLGAARKTRIHDDVRRLLYCRGEKKER